jgi:hypothetical protein
MVIYLLPVHPPRGARCYHYFDGMLLEQTYERKDSRKKKKNRKASSSVVTCTKQGIQLTTATCSFQVQNNLNI